VARQLGEHRRVVSGAGPDLEHSVGLAQLEQLAHPADHQGLRDRLPAVDRKRPVGVGAAPVAPRHEQLARNARDRVQHALVVDEGA